MKCARCEMLNQIPETPCSHCGRMLPALKPVIVELEPEEENGEENGGEKEAQENGGAPAEPGPAEGAEETETPPETEAVALDPNPEAGHVDNVGDATETETVT